MTWTINAQTLNLDHIEGRTSFTSAEFDQQRWPDCPVCHKEVLVDPIHVGGGLRPRDEVLVGRWRCVRGCDIPAALRQ